MAKQILVPIHEIWGVQKEIPRWGNKEKYKLVPSWEVNGTLEVHGTSPNNSAPNILLKDPTDGKVYYSTLDTLMQAFKEKRVVNGNKIDGHWYFKKQGRIVLLYLTPLKN